MADYDDIEEWIRNEDAGECLDDQVQTGYWFWDNDVTEPEDRWKRTTQVEDALEEDLEHGIRRVLQHLVDIEVLELKPGGENRYIRNHREEDNYWSPDQEGCVDAVIEEITRFLLDIRDQEQSLQPTVADGGSEEDPTLREVAADALDVTPDELVWELTGTIEFIDEVPEADSEDQLALDDPVERMNRYDKAVGAVMDHEEVERSRDYGAMGFRNQPNRYTLSGRAAIIEENASLSDF